MQPAHDIRPVRLVLLLSAASLTIGKHGISRQLAYQQMRQREYSNRPAVRPDRQQQRDPSIQAGLTATVQRGVLGRCQIHPRLDHSVPLDDSHTDRVMLLQPGHGVGGRGDPMFSTATYKNSLARGSTDIGRVFNDIVR